MTLDGLCAELNLTKHQIYRWVHRGALPPPNGCRSHPEWTHEHLAIARRIRDALNGESGPRTLDDFADRRRNPRTVQVDRVS